MLTFFCQIFASAAERSASRPAAAIASLNCVASGAIFLASLKHGEASRASRARGSRTAAPGKIGLGQDACARRSVGVLVCPSWHERPLRRTGPVAGAPENILQRCVGCRCTGCSLDACARCPLPKSLEMTPRPRQLESCRRALPAGTAPHAAPSTQMATFMLSKRPEKEILEITGQKARASSCQCHPPASTIPAGSALHGAHHAHTWHALRSHARAHSARVPTRARLALGRAGVTRQVDENARRP